MVIRVVVPWRPDGGDRDRIWAFCKPRWDSLPVVESPSPDGPFNRAAAINAGASGEWDVLVVVDADVVLASLNQLAAGIDMAAQREQVVYPFKRYVGMTPEATQTVLEGGSYSDRGAFRTPTHKSSVVIIPRTVWDRMGPFEERFTGWGFEDTEFARRARPFSRVRGDVFHLWHPRSEHKRSGPLYEANLRLAAALQIAARK